MTNTWIFYGKDRNGIKTIHFIKECKKPERTKEYNEIRNLLKKNDKYEIVGCMTSNSWNKGNQYIKVVQ